VIVSDGVLPALRVVAGFTLGRQLTAVLIFVAGAAIPAQSEECAVTVVDPDQGGIGRIDMGSLMAFAAAQP
jgi:hypothetical protein